MGGLLEVERWDRQVMDRKYFEHIKQAESLYVLCEPLEILSGMDKSFTQYPIQIIDVGLTTVTFFYDTKPQANLHIRMLPIGKFTKRKWYPVTTDYADDVRKAYNKPAYCKGFLERKALALGNIIKSKIKESDTPET